MKKSLGAVLSRGSMELNSHQTRSISEKSGDSPEIVAAGVFSITRFR